jgi:hypothetical protein
MRHALAFPAKFKDGVGECCGTLAVAHVKVAFRRLLHEHISVEDSPNAVLAVI